jgi:hypothetical protein
VRVADAPDKIVLKEHRDLEGRDKELWIRRGLFALFPLVGVLALLNVFGQRPGTSTAAAPEATLKLYAPARVRSGLLFQARFTITAKQDVKDAMLVLDPGWAESMTINTIEPSPVGEASKDGNLSFDLGHIPAGQKYRLFMEFQVNPTNVGRRSADVALFDGETKLATIDRTISIWP